MYEMIRKCPLPPGCGVVYQGMAYDGCRYYLTCHCQPEITVLDCCSLTVCEVIPVCRPYTAICFDPTEGCFWAAARGCSSAIYKLDCCFREIDRVTLCDLPGTVGGLSCCPDGCLLVVVGDSVYRLCLCPYTVERLRSFCGAFLSGVCCFAPYALVPMLQGCRQSLAVVCPDGTVEEKLTLPENCIVKSIIFVGRCGCAYKFAVLVVKNGCYPYFVEVAVNPDCFRLPCCPCAPCELDCCKEHCGCLPTPGESCEKVMESIALVETAIAHILNAEGEKLQKVIACSDDVEKILEVNQSVNRTIVNATHLEQTLYAKLESIRECCKKECPCVNVLPDTD